MTRCFLIALMLLVGCTKSFEREPEVPLENGGSAGMNAGQGASGGASGMGDAGGVSGSGNMSGTGGASGTGGMSGTGGTSGTGGLMDFLCPGNLFIPCIPVAQPAVRCCTANRMCGIKANANAPCL